MHCQTNGYCVSIAAVVKRIEGGTKMFGADQLVVALWFLPVIIFIVLPLAIGCVWGFLSVLISPFRQTTSLRGPIRAAQTAA